MGGRENDQIRRRGARQSGGRREAEEGEGRGGRKGRIGKEVRGRMRMRVIVGDCRRICPSVVLCASCV